MKNKDVVHVRAKRGQATDSHSLSERVSPCTMVDLDDDSHTTKNHPPMILMMMMGLYKTEKTAP